MLPSIPLVTVNADPVTVLGSSNDNKLQHQKDIYSDEKVAMLLETVPSSRENKPDHEGFIDILLNTPVDTVFADQGSVETPSKLCETPSSSRSQIRRRERQREYQKRKRVKEISLVDDRKYLPSLVTI